MNENVVVFDFGGSTLKAGYGGESEPSIIIPSTGPTTTVHGQNGLSDKIVPLLGNGFKSPIENRVINNFENMEKLLNFIYQHDLRVTPEKQSVLFADSPLSSIQSKEKLLQIFMETYRVPYFCLSNAPTLSLYNSGVTSGIVIDSGESVTDIVPIYEGFTLSHLIQRVEIGGRHINEYLKRLVVSQNPQISGEKGLFREMKEQIGCVQEYNDQKILGKEFETPDKKKIIVGDSRYLCSEILFNPSLISSNSTGLIASLNQIIGDLDLDIKPQMLDKVLLCGGSTLLEGFSNRIKNELKQDNGILAPPNRKIASWVGGSIFSSIETFKDIAISQKDYMEYGPKIITIKVY